MLHRVAADWRNRAWFPPVATLLALSFVSAALLGGVGYEVADRLVHPPRDLPRVTPADRGLPYERVAFTAEDGIQLTGWWMPATRLTGAVESPTVLFLHGYGASKAQSLSVAPFLVRAGYNVLAFDFRAHGESGGGYTTVGLEEVKDVAAAWGFLASRPDVALDRVAILGWSMGGATGLNAAEALPEARAFIVDSTFASLENVVSHTLPAFTGLPTQPFGGVGILFASMMVGRGVWENEPARAIAQFDRPLLIIQGMMDPIAQPDTDGAALHDAAGPFSELWLVPDADHVNARRVDPAAYEDRVLGFLALHLAESSPAVGEAS